MYTFSDILDIDSKLVVCALILFAFFVYFEPLLADRYGLLRYPGPLLAKISNLWFAHKVLKGNNATVVHNLHEKYGTFVRISPKQVSIADPEALQVVYGYSSRTLKSELYEGFVVHGKNASMFSTRVRDVHSRKRKYSAHTLSLKGIQQLEPNILHHQALLVKQWDRLCVSGAKNEDGTMGSCTWKARGGRVWFNCMPWFNYEAFDIIGDLAFGAPFGMLESVQDAAPVATSREKAIQSYYSENKEPIECTMIPAIQTVNEASTIGTFLGCFPERLRPLFFKLPIFKERVRSRALFATMGVTALAKRLASGDSRTDILSNLIAFRDENGQPLPEGELSAEAQSFLVAGSDTTSNSLGAIAYYLARYPAVQAKLQEELDAALGPPSLDSFDEGVPNYDQVKNLAYLQDVIDEGLRVHSTICIGLPRIVPETGLTVAGKTFTAGTEVSCPTLTIHRLKSVWGEDADQFNPDRWSRGNRAEMTKYFIPFSIGPRACIGRNLAMVEMSICVAAIFHRYHFVLEDPNKELQVTEGFVRKPEAVPVGIKRRA